MRFIKKKIIESEKMNENKNQNCIRTSNPSPNYELVIDITIKMSFETTLDV